MTTFARVLCVTAAMAATTAFAQEAPVAPAAPSATPPAEVTEVAPSAAAESPKPPRPTPIEPPPVEPVAAPVVPPGPAPAPVVVPPSIDDLTVTAWGVRLKPNGFILGNVRFNSGSPLPTLESPVAAAAGSTAPYLSSGPGLASDGSFLITARQSRLGLDLGVDLDADTTLDGKFEVDFFGLHNENGGAAILQSTIRLRSLYLDIGGKNLRLRVGQDWAPFTPRGPLSLAHVAIPAFHSAGYLYNRFPQVAVHYQRGLSIVPEALGKPTFVTKLAFLRPFSSDHPDKGVIQFDTQEPGLASMLPTVEGRVGFESKMLSVGVSGHGGAESYVLTDAAAARQSDKLLETWAVGADMKVSAFGFFLSSSGFIGANLNTLFGMSGVRKVAFVDDAGAPVPLTLKDVNPIGTYGGWAQAGYGLFDDKVQFFAGAGAEALTDATLANPGEQVMNTGAQIGALYAPYKNFDCSLEVYHARTFYNAADAAGLGDNTSVAASARFKF